MHRFYSFTVFALISYHNFNGLSRGDSDFLRSGAAVLALFLLVHIVVHLVEEAVDGFLAAENSCADGK